MQMLGNFCSSFKRNDNNLPAPALGGGFVVSCPQSNRKNSPTINNHYSNDTYITVRYSNATVPSFTRNDVAWGQGSFSGELRRRIVEFKKTSQERDVNISLQCGEGLLICET
jgi:hypothetical protein